MTEPISSQPSAHGRQATFGMMLGGYAAAYGRLATALDHQEDTTIFHALFEALNWATTIDDEAGSRWVPEGEPLKQGWRERVRGAESMEGIRYARNSVHHHWADAVQLDHSGRRYPRRYPVRYFELMWRPRSELPQPRNPSGGDAYDRLATNPVDVTLHQLGEAFDDVWRFLEFPGTLGRPDIGFSQRSLRE